MMVDRGFRTALLYVVVFASLLFAALAKAAIDPDEFDSDAQRNRYHHFIADLRCPKCQNQNLAGSDAPIANDLRKELRRLLKEGQSDQQIVDFMVSRYGDFILYKPPFDRHTAVLWLTPVGLLGAGLIVIGTIVWRHRRARAEATAPLTVAEQGEIAALLREGDSVSASPTKSSNKPRNGGGQRA
jgi:cytochrome c-type biogenesis protein CcmH